MKRPKKSAAEPPIQGHTISHCNFQNGVQVNEHTRAAVEALAGAAKANADAINAVAKALQGGNANMEAPMLHLQLPG